MVCLTYLMDNFFSDKIQSVLCASASSTHNSFHIMSQSIQLGCLYCRDRRCLARNQTLTDDDFRKDSHPPRWHQFSLQYNSYRNSESHALFVISYPSRRCSDCRTFKEESDFQDEIWYSHNYFHLIN